MGTHCHLKKKHWQIDNIKKVQSLRPILTNSTPLQVQQGKFITTDGNQDKDGYQKTSI